MHDFIQATIVWYFDILKQIGLWGVVLLMAMESSIFPVPSELVVPPAAYLESHRKGGHIGLTLLVILAGTVGSYLGSAITYYVARLVGRPLIVRYGKFFFIPEKKLKLAEDWVARYGAGGIFIARLLPVVRHLISIPAGIVGMRFRTFSIMTILGSAIWCTVLTIFGLVMAQDMEIIITQPAHAAPESTKHAYHNLTLAMAGMIAVVGVLYVLVMRLHGKHSVTPSEDTADV